MPTIGLAGLISDNTSRGNSGIPYLKDIPVLGTLFSFGAAAITLAGIELGLVGGRRLLGERRRRPQLGLRQIDAASLRIRQRGQQKGSDGHRYRTDDHESLL